MKNLVTVMIIVLILTLSANPAKAGLLIINDEKIQECIKKIWIISHNGKSMLESVSSLNPNPVDGGLVSPGEVELSWTLPDPCVPGQPVLVDVYFTDDLQLLEQFANNRAAIQVVSKQNVKSVIVQTQIKTWYYWAVDVYVGSDEDPTFGPIFSFFADNIPPIVTIVNGQEYQLGECTGTVIGDCSFYDASCDDWPNGEDDCNNDVIGCYWVGCTGTTSCDNFDGDSWFCNYVGCSWDGCTGSQTVPCSAYGTDQDFCEFMGCSWDGSTCTGSPGDCSSFDSSVCDFILGCSWDGCSGTDAPCDVFDCQDDCEYFGCSWLACQGTATPCEELDEYDCGSQCGCSWRDIVTWLEDGFRIVNLDATITDDGLPGPYTVLWAVVKEPNEGTAIIVTPTTEDTSVILLAAGDYVLQLEAFDGEYIGSDIVTIKVYNDSCEAAQSLPGYIRLTGNLNGDCRVDEVDLELLLESWLKDNSLTEEWFTIN